MHSLDPRPHFTHGALHGAHVMIEHMSFETLSMSCETKRDMVRRGVPCRLSPLVSAIASKVVIRHYIIVTALC